MWETLIADSCTSCYSRIKYSAQASRAGATELSVEMSTNSSLDEWGEYTGKTTKIWLEGEGVLQSIQDNGPGVRSVDIQISDEAVIDWSVAGVILGESKHVEHVYLEYGGYAVDEMMKFCRGFGRNTSVKRLEIKCDPDADHMYNYIFPFFAGNTNLESVVIHDISTFPIWLKGCIDASSTIKSLMLSGNVEFDWGDAAQEKDVIQSVT